MKNNLGELKKNYLLIAIAKVGSGAIGFILAPMYSFYMTAGQYGTMDLIIITCSLLVPFTCLDIYEAAFRFTKDNKYDNHKIITTALSVCVCGVLIYLAFFVGYAVFCKINLNIPIVICAVSTVLDSINFTINQYARGQDKISVYAFSGALNSLVILLSNILFLIALKMELMGWMVSFVLAKVVVLIYLVFRLQLWHEISLCFFDKNFLCEGVRYSLPLMPTASMWWLMNVSDRYVLNFYCGLAATGIYAVANKIPAILSVFENVFYQAWQTTAINTLSDEDRDHFYSGIFNNYFHLLAVGVVGILLILKPFIVNLFASEYSSSWICAAVLVVGVMIHALGGNLGVLYTVFKDTKGALKTSFIGAITNIVLNIIFIPKFGMLAAAGTTLASYVVVLIIRWFDVRKFVTLSFSLKNEWVTIVLILIQFVLYYVPGILPNIIKTLILLLCLYIHKDIIIKILRKK